MDQLTMDSIAAQKAGMSYGKWKALHYVPDVVVPKQPKELVHPGCEVKQKKYCAICGKSCHLVNPDTAPGNAITRTRR